MSEASASAPDKLIFPLAWCSIVATAFGFILRALVLGDLGTEFNLSATELGALSGVGLWPFALSIAVFSLIIDKIGFRLIFIFALLCHLASTFMLLTAHNYTQLFMGTFVLSLGNGAVEAAANPLIASVYRNDRIRWLNYLHAGWPSGQVLGGLLTIVLGVTGITASSQFGLHAWKLKIALIMIPVLIYGVLIIGRKFPVTERVAAKVSYRDMLKEPGAIGSAALSWVAFTAIFGAFLPTLGPIAPIVCALVVGAGFYAYTRSLGTPLYVLILLMMMPQAITELGTASWVTDLVSPQMAQLGADAGWVLVATNVVLMATRFSAGSVVHRVSPVLMLTFSALVSGIAMVMFAYTSGWLIILAALLFGLGTAFFWPTTLGFVSEQFPRSGSVGINFVGAAGMLAAGSIGATLMGTVQDKSNEAYLTQNAPAVASVVLGEPKPSLLGAYRPIDQAKVTPAEAPTVTAATNNGKSVALRDMAILPAVLFVLYGLLLLMFRRRGGYKRNVLEVSEESMAKTPTGA
jgi:MFS family permease